MKLPKPFPTVCPNCGKPLHVTYNFQIDLEGWWYLFASVSFILNLTFFSHFSLEGILPASYQYWYWGGIISIIILSLPYNIKKKAE